MFRSSETLKFRLVYVPLLLPLMSVNFTFSIVQLKSIYCDPMLQILQFSLLCLNLNISLICVV